MRNTHNRERIMARHRDDTPVSGNRSVGTNPGARASTPVKEYGWTGTRRHGNKTRYAGSGDKGYGSAWSRSPEFWTDPKWSRTVSDVTA